jgi:hypothetical protein
MADNLIPIKKEDLPPYLYSYIAEEAVETAQTIGWPFDMSGYVNTALQDFRESDEYQNWQESQVNTGSNTGFLASGMPLPRKPDQYVFGSARDKIPGDVIPFPGDKLIIVDTSFIDPNNLFIRKPALYRSYREPITTYLYIGTIDPQAIFIEALPKQRNPVYQINPITPNRLLGVLTLAIWPTTDLAGATEAEVAGKTAIRFLSAIEVTDLPELRTVMSQVLAGPAKQPGAMEKLRLIYKNAVESNPRLPVLEVAGNSTSRRASAPPPPPPSSSGTTTGTHSPREGSRRGGRTRRTHRAAARSGSVEPGERVRIICVICGLDSRGKPLCRKHYYESIGKDFVEICQHSGCHEPSYGQPLCRKHYYRRPGQR